MPLNSNRLSRLLYGMSGVSLFKQLDLDVFQ